MHTVGAAKVEQNIFEHSMCRQIRRYNILLIDLSLPSQNNIPMKIMPMKNGVFVFVTWVISQYACWCEQVWFLLIRSHIFLCVCIYIDFQQNTILFVFLNCA